MTQPMYGTKTDTENRLVAKGMGRWRRDGLGV